MSRVCIRYEALQPGHLTTDWAWFRDLSAALDHGMLCKAFKLDPFRTKFELPSTARGVGSSMGLQNEGGRAREVSGFVFFAGLNDPIAKLVFAREGDRFPDVNPFDRSEFERLGTTR